MSSEDILSELKQNYSEDELKVFAKARGRFDQEVLRALVLLLFLFSLVGIVFIYNWPEPIFRKLMTITAIIPACVAFSTIILQELYWRTVQREKYLQRELERKENVKKYFQIIESLEDEYTHYELRQSQR